MTSKYVPKELLLSMLSKMPRPMQGIWQLCIETGVRVSDALGVTAGQFDGNTFHYTAKKTGKKGSAPVSAAFRQRYVDGHMAEQYLFPNPRTAKPYTRQAVWHHVKRAAKLCGLDPEGISPHSSRKAFAVELFEHEGLGKTMHALQHRDASTTLLYAMSDDPLAQLRKDFDRLRSDFDWLRADYDRIRNKIITFFNERA